MPPSPVSLLNFLFLTIARKVRPLGLRESTAVARYLEFLGWESGPGPNSEFLKNLSQVIWSAALQHAEFKTAEKEEVLKFLNKFADTHLASYDVAAAIEIVGSLPSPKKQRRLPTLRAPFMSVTMGPGTPRLSDDLSERICAGYWAVRFANLRNARQYVADALNRHRVGWNPRLDAESSWSVEQVAQRVKQYERQAFARRPDRKDARQRLVDKWVALYYPNPAWEEIGLLPEASRQRRKH